MSLTDVVNLDNLSSEVQGQEGHQLQR